MSPDGDTPRMTGTDIRQGRQFGREATYDMDMHILRFAFFSTFKGHGALQAHREIVEGVEKV